MKINSIIAVLSIFLIVSVQGQSPIPRYDITVDQDDLKHLYSRNIFDDERIPVVFHYDGRIWPDAEMRFKGNTTRFYSKKPFRFQFKRSNPFVRNVRRWPVNAMYTDKSYLREKLTWELASEMGMTAPTADYARIYLNDRSMGLYLYVERVDEYFIENRGMNVEGSLYRPPDTIGMGDLTVQDDPSKYREYYTKYLPLDSHDYSDLIEMIEAINYASDAEFESVVTALFDIHSVVDWLALNTLTTMGDTYNKDYYLYRDPAKNTQQWIVIPWDYDLSWGRNADSELPYPNNLLVDGFNYYFPPASGPDNVLKDRFMETPSLVALLRDRIEELLGTYFTVDHISQRIDSLVAVIENDVKLDTFKWGTNREFYEQADALKYYTHARSEFLLNTFVNEPSGQYTEVELPYNGTNVPHHFITRDGRLIGTLRVTEAHGLEKITLRVEPGTALPYITKPEEERYVRRVFHVTPHPQSASLKADMRLEYLDRRTNRTEVGLGVQDERELKLHMLNGQLWTPLETKVNYHANTLTTTVELNTTATFAALLPVDNQSWYVTGKHYWHRLRDIRFFNEQEGIAVGDDGLALLTNDGGTTWSDQDMNFNMPFYRVGFFDNKSMISIGNLGNIRYQEAGDERWHWLSTPTYADLFGLAVAGDSTVWIAGEGGRIALSHDLGKNWQRTDLSRNITFADITGDMNDGVYAISRQGEIFQFNADVSLTGRYSIPSPGDLNRIRSRQGNELFVVGNDGFLAVSNDAQSWEVISVPTSADLYDIGFAGDEGIFVIGAEGTMLYSPDNGATWFPQPVVSSNDLHAITFVSPTKGYVVGNQGTILRTTVGGVVSVEDVHKDIPQSIVLHQNYPNPFNPATTIRFELQQSERITIEIFDILGRKITTLLDDMQGPGTHEVQFNGALLSSGIYFYRLTSPGTSIVKRMVLTK